jgi:hypothetical protein
MPDRIVAVRSNPREPAQGFAKILTDDGETLEAWSPEFAKLEKLNGLPIPEGWSLRDNKQGTGKVLLPPKERGGGGFRQSREAFELEAKSRERWQLLEEERKDRRTALMQAREMMSDPASGVWTGTLYELADEMYAWLRASGAEAAGEPSSAAGAGLDPAPGKHPRSSDRGKVAAAEAPEGGRAQATVEGSDDAGTSAKPSGSTYPFDPASCRHRFPSGNWLHWATEDGKEVCPRCGTPKLAAMESTTADLGPA